MKTINLSQKFELFHEHWHPRIVGELNDSYVKLARLKGEFVIIPKGVEHCPMADEEVQVLLLESKSTVNTGDVQNERTVAAAWIR